MFGFKKKTIVDNIKDFQRDFKVTQLVSYQYLLVWFKQVFSTPEYKSIFADKPKMPQALAAEIIKYLSAQDPIEIVDYGEETESMQMAKKHVQKWSDDVMERDKDFAKLRIMTLRLDMIYSQYVTGTKYMNTPRGKRIGDLLMKYGHLDHEEPSPEKYSKLLAKWIIWGDAARKKGLLEDA